MSSPINIEATEIKKTFATAKADLKARAEAFQTATTTRAKADWAAACSELIALSAKLKSNATLAWTRLRDDLDLSRRGEVANLAARVDELTRRVDDYAAHATR